TVGIEGNAPLRVSKPQSALPGIDDKVESGAVTTEPRPWDLLNGARGRRQPEQAVFLVGDPYIPCGVLDHRVRLAARYSLERIQPAAVQIIEPRRRRHPRSASSAVNKRLYAAARYRQVRNVALVPPVQSASRADRNDSVVDEFDRSHALR